MKSTTPRIIGSALILLAIPFLMLCGTILLLSGWGLCGDVADCNPSASAVTVIALVDLATIISAIGIILVIVANFKLGKLLSDKPNTSVPIVYYWMIGCIILAILSVVLGLMRVLSDNVYMLISGVAAITAFILSIYFLRTYRNK